MVHCAIEIDEVDKENETQYWLLLLLMENDLLSANSFCSLQFRKCLLFCAFKYKWLVKFEMPIDRPNTIAYNTKQTTHTHTNRLNAMGSLTVSMAYKRNHQMTYKEQKKFLQN